MVGSLGGAIFCCVFIFTCTSAMTIEDTKFLKLFNYQERIFYFGNEKLSDFEIVYLPSELSEWRYNIDETASSSEVRLSFEAFNMDIDLILHPNHQLISTYTNVVRLLDNDRRVKVKTNFTAIDCHFLSSKDSKLTASISNCGRGGEISGLIFLQRETLEILPVPERLKFVHRRISHLKNGKIVNEIPHIVRKSNFEESFGEDEFHPDGLRIGQHFPIKTKVSSTPNVEIALFFDEAFHQTYSKFFNNDHDRMLNFILTYVNGMQSLFHHKSLKRKIEFSIVHLEIMEIQPFALPHHYGERTGLIDSFCTYQRNLNPRDDRNPHHWDMAAYISGLDLFAWGQFGSKDRGTMGMAAVSGVCNFDHNCLIAEFGVNNQFGKPYPSTGFASIFILAHEIGHNLGMLHDSVGNSCTKDGFVMSASRGFIGEASWSQCSAKSAEELEWADCIFDQSPKLSHYDWKLDEYPGEKISIKRQCEILTRDQHAYPFTNDDLSSICHNLHCRTPDSSSSEEAEIFFAGPALTGTKCGINKWCNGGNCIAKEPEMFDEVESKCESACLTGGRGVEVKKKFGSKSNINVDKKICDDGQICKSRRSVISYGTSKCQEYSRLVDVIDPNGYGLQGTLEKNDNSMACSIYCKRTNSSFYFSPKIHLNELGLNPYYPDGTLCHSEGKVRYYCINARCLPY